MADSRDILGKNRRFTGTEGIKIPGGTTAERGSTAGTLRYNTETNSFEFRDNTGTTEFLSPPQITSLDTYDVDTDTGGDITFTITGKNFKTGAVVSFIDIDGTSVNATTTVVSRTQITATLARSNFTNAKEPYDVKITNGDALTVILENQVNVDNDPVWQTGASLATIYQDLSYNIQFSATDSDGDAVTYSHISGTLPTGMTFSSSGLLSGTGPTIVGPTTFTFTLRATANSKTADREFTQLVEQNSSPEWVTAAGSIATVYDSQRATAVSGGIIPALQATDAQGETITYTVTAGTLPTGLTLNSNGTWSGTPNAEATNTTYSFTATIDDGAGTPTVNRNFSITIYAPAVQAFTTQGEVSTWTAPLTGNIEVLAVGAAGAFGAQGGCPGAGGVCYNGSYAVTSGTAYDYTVGTNGQYISGSGLSNGANGGSSKFGISGDAEEIIAIGGCGGAEGPNANGSTQVNGGANEGSYMCQVGAQVLNCYHRSQTLGTSQAGTGGTVYGGYRAGTSQCNHYNWNTAASAGAAGNGSSTPNCGGNGQGGAGVNVASLNSAFGTYAVSNIMAVGRSGSGYYGSTGQITGFGSYGSPDTSGPNGVGGCVILVY
jgi:hypothetical protein